MPLEAAIGPARVIVIKNSRTIEAEELRIYRIRKGERLLFKTRNSRGRWSREKSHDDFVSLSRQGAEYLAERRVTY